MHTSTGHGIIYQSRGANAMNRNSVRPFCYGIVPALREWATRNTIATPSPIAASLSSIANRPTNQTRPIPRSPFQFKYINERFLFCLSCGSHQPFVGFRQSDAPPAWTVSRGGKSFFFVFFSSFFFAFPFSSSVSVRFRGFIHVSQGTCTWPPGSRRWNGIRNQLTVPTHASTHHITPFLPHTCLTVPHPWIQRRSSVRAPIGHSQPQPAWTVSSHSIDERLTINFCRFSFIWKTMERLIVAFVAPLTLINDYI